MLSDAHLNQLCSRVPGFESGPAEVGLLEKGGSDREFYRIRSRSGTSVILIRYGDGREENLHYAAIAEFLAGIPIHVPRIYHHDEVERLILMEDLGDRDLWSYREEDWEHLGRLYRSALDEILRLHTRKAERLEQSSLTLQMEFNEDLYQWEQGYFMENCLGRLFDLPPEEILAGCPTNAFNEIAARLAALPRVLVHRDFQSQNILISEEQPYLIDFQGLRPGLPQYDLASLLYDPYVHLPPKHRNELLDYYYLASGAPMPEAEFREIYDLCALQRIMQALGAYGFLGTSMGKPQFLGYVDPALESLRGIASRIPGLEEFSRLLDRLPSNPVKS